MPSYNHTNKWRAYTQRMVLQIEGRISPVPDLTMTDEEVVEAAENFCTELDGKIELDPDHEIQRVDHPKGQGAWVKAWIWIAAQ